MYSLCVLSCHRLKRLLSSLHVTLRRFSSPVIGWTTDSARDEEPIPSSSFLPMSPSPICTAGFLPNDRALIDLPLGEGGGEWRARPTFRSKSVWLLHWRMLRLLQAPFRFDRNAVVLFCATGFSRVAPVARPYAAGCVWRFEVCINILINFLGDGRP